MLELIPDHCFKLKLLAIEHKVGRSKQPLVLTSGFNRLKLPGQYAKKWSILVNMNLSGRLEFLNGYFGGGL